MNLVLRMQQDVSYRDARIIPGLCVTLCVAISLVAIAFVMSWT